MNKKILLIDDSKVVVGVLTDFLESEGYEIISESNGYEGIITAYKEMPDLIIVDVEMPLLQGYQVCRLLKNSRGVKDIPVIINTSLNEDKDQYWAIASGADAFITKDFNNSEILKQKIEGIINHPPYDLEAIKEDSRGMTKDNVFEMIAELFDRELFRSTITNMIIQVSKHIGCLSDSVYDVFELLLKACEYHVAVVFLKYERRTLAFIQPTCKVDENEIKEFYKICFSDFYSHFSECDPTKVEKEFFQETRFNNCCGDMNDENIKPRQANAISSYSYFPIYGKGDDLIGTLHVGHVSNNYYSNYLIDNIAFFMKPAGLLVENSVLFNRNLEIESKIRNTFAKFVPQEIINDLIEKDKESELLSEKREVVILFSDIRSFTTISEHNSAENMVKMLNNYFDVMAGIIKKQGGIIDKFIGDAILATFGGIYSYDDNALRAVKAATEMVEALEMIDVSYLNMAGVKLACGIGIHEGMTIVGNIGSKNKLDYTVIGDNVNLASRIEGLTKFYHQKLIISETVKNKIGKEYFTRELDVVKVKGKNKSVKLFSVEDQNHFGEEFLEQYYKGIRSYKLGNWSSSKEYFEASLELCPNDFMSQLYIDRCNEFIKNPPEEWDGAMSFDFK